MVTLCICDLSAWHIRGTRYRFVLLSYPPPEKCLWFQISIQVSLSKIISFVTFLVTFFSPKDLETSPCGWRLFSWLGNFRQAVPWGKSQEKWESCLFADGSWSWVRPGYPGPTLAWPHHSRLLAALWLPLVISREGTSESLVLTRTHTCTCASS